MIDRSQVLHGIIGEVDAQEMGSDPFAPFVPDSVEEARPDPGLGLILAVAPVDLVIAGGPLEIAGDEDRFAVLRPQKIVDAALELGELPRAPPAESDPPDLRSVRASRDKPQRTAVGGPARGEIAARPGSQRSRAAARRRNDPDAGDVAILLE